jgi:hypothetical protein
VPQAKRIQKSEMEIVEVEIEALGFQGIISSCIVPIGPLYRFKSNLITVVVLW